ncbi:hypothetical protein ABIB73_007542 [Bradyrhizobium sp. F1.4.3]
MSDLTTIELLWLEKRIENRIRFGKAISEKVIDHHRRILSFGPGSTFAFVRWTSNDFGTILSRIDILRAITPGQRYSTVPWVSPGGESLLRLAGWRKVERVLELIDAVESLGIDPADAAPSIGITSTTGFPSTKRHDLIRVRATRRGSAGAGWCSDGAAKDSSFDMWGHNARALAGHRHLTVVHLERFRKCADRPLPFARDRTIAHH